MLKSFAFLLCLVVSLSNAEPLVNDLRNNLGPQLRSELAEKKCGSEVLTGEETLIQFLAPISGDPSLDHRVQKYRVSGTFPQLIVAIEVISRGNSSWQDKIEVRLKNSQTFQCVGGHWVSQSGNGLAQLSRIRVQERGTNSSFADFVLSQNQRAASALLKQVTTSRNWNYTSEALHTVSSRDLWSNQYPTPCIRGSSLLTFFKDDAAIQQPGFCAGSLNTYEVGSFDSLLINPSTVKSDHAFYTKQVMTPGGGRDVMRISRHYNAISQRVFLVVQDFSKATYVQLIASGSSGGSCFSNMLVGNSPFEQFLFGLEAARPLDQMLGNFRGYQLTGLLESANLFGEYYLN